MHSIFYILHFLEFAVDLCRKSIYNVDNRYIDELHKREGYRMKIIVRIVKSSIRRCLPCLMSVILVSAALFLFEGIKEMFLGIMSKAERLRSSLGISAHLYIYVLLFIGIILILYTVNNYSRIRLRDYGTLLVLGSEKGAVIRMMLAEYGMISAVSYAGGMYMRDDFLVCSKSRDSFGGHPYGTGRADVSVRRVQDPVLHAGGVWSRGVYEYGVSAGQFAGRFDEL